MIMTSSKCLFIVFLLIIAHISVESKRSGGRSRGSSRGSSGFSRNKPKVPEQASSSYSLFNQKPKEKATSNVKTEPAKVAPKIEPSAPKHEVSSLNKASPVNHQNAAPPAPVGFDGRQQASNGQRPVGWNVGNEGPANRQTAYNSAAYPREAPPSYNVAAAQKPHYPSSGSFGVPNGQGGSQNGYASHVGSYPNTGANSYYGTGNSYSYGSAHHPPPAYQANPGGGYPNAPSGYPHAPAGYPNSPGGYHNAPVGYPNAPSGYPNAPAGYPNAPAGYPNAPNGFGNQGFGNPGFGNQGFGMGGGQGAYGQNPYNQGFNNMGQPKQSGGFLGGLFGGNKNGYGGGYGGYGGGNRGFGSFGPMGAYGAYGMMKQKKSGFFGKHAFRNILAGLLVWNLVKAGIGYKYRVYNHYNHHDHEPQDLTLPANLITLCPEEAANVCLPNTVALCTTNNTILCVASISTLTPCEDNAKLNCANTTIPCVEGDPSCNNTATQDVAIPCIGNATIDGFNSSSLVGQSLVANGGSLDSTNNVFCVTTLALPEGEGVPCNGTQNNDPCNPAPVEITELPDSTSSTSNFETTTMDGVAS